MIICSGCNGTHEKTEEATTEDENRIGARKSTAKLIVSLPADAKLTINGQATTSSSAKRTFVTPTLQNGREYYYTLKAVVTRDGKQQEVSERVSIRAGKTTNVTLSLPATELAQR